MDQWALWSRGPLDPRPFGPWAFWTEYPQIPGEAQRIRGGCKSGVSGICLYQHTPLGVTLQASLTLIIRTHTTGSRFNDIVIHIYRMSSISIDTSRVPSVVITVHQVPDLFDRFHCCSSMYVDKYSSVRMGCCMSVAVCSWLFLVCACVCVCVLVSVCLCLCASPL